MKTYNVELISIRVSNANIVVSSMNILFMFLAADQVLRVAFSLWENLNVVDLHWVFKVLCQSPWKNMTSAVINVWIANAGEITVIDFSFKHQQRLKIVENCWTRLTKKWPNYDIILQCLYTFEKFWVSYNFFDIVLLVASKFDNQVGRFFARNRRKLVVEDCTDL